jgi:hypothetical protein
MKIAAIEVIVVSIPFAGGSKSAETAWGKKERQQGRLSSGQGNDRGREGSTDENMIRKCH